MTRFIVIYRDSRGANHTAAVCAKTSCGAVKTVLNTIPEAESAWTICTA